MDLSYDPPEAFRHAVPQLHDLVAAEVGGDDFGPPDYLPGLTVLLQSMDYDPRFTERGRRAAWGRVVNALRARASAFRAMGETPGFEATAIVSPVVITGVPRTGTTALHRLLAVDPRFQGLQTWLTETPMPRPPRERWGDYPAFRRTVAQLEARDAATPERRAAHHVAADQVEECCLLLYQSFVSNIWTAGWSTATYDAWWQARSEAPAYAHYRRCLQLIGSTEPDKRWLLKNPGHIETLDLLFAVFPDARVIQTHRDPAKAVPSLVSLLMQLHPLFEDGRLQQRREIMLRREVAKWANAAAKAHAVAARHPSQVMDVVHADFHARPMAVVERIYEFIGWSLPDETRAAMAVRIAEKPELAHGVHRYDIADYGMTEDEVRAEFGDYVARHDLVERRG